MGRIAAEVTASREHIVATGEGAGKPDRHFPLLYAALYGGYGALSPFLPAFLSARGLGASEIGTLLAAAMLVRLAAGPFIGRRADRQEAVRSFLAGGLALSAVLTLAFLAGHGFPVLLAVALVQAAATAPLAPLADALALAGTGNAAYGRIRAAGSAAFIATTILTGQFVGAFGPGAGLGLGAALFGAAAAVTRRLPNPASRPCSREIGGFGLLAADARFRRLLLAAALVIGSHAMHDAFAVIIWQRAGIGPRAAGLLWAEAVAAEVAVFLWLGPRLLEHRPERWAPAFGKRRCKNKRLEHRPGSDIQDDALARLGPARALALAATAAALRWAVQAQTSWLPALIGIQALHGLTFGLLHLACLRLIAEFVPEHRRATALAVYGTFGLGLASAVMTLASGPLYDTLGPRGFWVMAAVSLSAVPVARSLSGSDQDPHSPSCDGTYIEQTRQPS